MDIDGTNIIQLTNALQNDKNPKWSPDGTQIVYVSTPHRNENIYLMNADGSNQIPLVTFRSNDFVPCWSPDGKRIAFQSAIKTNDNELTNNPGWDTHPHWFSAPLEGNCNE